MILNCQCAFYSNATIALVSTLAIANIMHAAEE